MQGGPFFGHSQVGLDYSHPSSPVVTQGIPQNFDRPVRGVSRRLAHLKHTCVNARALAFSLAGAGHDAISLA